MRRSATPRSGLAASSWTTRPLGDIAIVGSGGTPSRSEPDYWNGDVPWVTTAEVDFNTIECTSEHITDAGLRNSAAKILPAGTLLMALYGQGKTRGKVAVLGIAAATNQACASIRIGPTASPDFVRYYLESQYDAIRNASNSGSQDNLSGQIVKQLPIILPPLPEQRAIAAALSDVDALIAALDQLIAKKRDLKTATMQQLLTGQRRLPGFTGPWPSTRLGERGTFSKGKGIRKGDVLGDGLPCIRYGEIYTHHDDVIRRFFSFVSPAVARESVRLRRGDIVFAGSGETAEEIGKCVAFVDDVEAYVGSDTVVFSPADDNSVFLAYLVNTLAAVVAQRMRMAQGDAVVHIGAKNLAALSFACPPQGEQGAIVDVLLDMDAEIEALLARREKTKLVKGGMMQELLTGRTRLVQVGP